MSTRLLHVVLAGALCAAPAAPADEAPVSSETAMTAEQKAQMEAFMKAGAPGPAHAALAAQAGTYDMALQSWEQAGGEAATSTGTATRAMILDGRVMTEDVRATTMGMPFTGYGMRGFDNVSGRHWATWNDSMSTGIMVSEGTCDEKHACTFTGSWNDPVQGRITSRMTSRWTSPTTEVFEMHVPGKDGKEFKMMEITYTKR